MKKVVIVLAALVAIGLGASTFLLVRRSTTEIGAATRDDLAAKAIAALNGNDTSAMLALLVGPASDDLAAECDEERTTSDGARAKRVADGLALSRPPGLVVDHMGGDQTEVLHEKGAAISPHCKARATIVRHATTLALHDTANKAWTAELVAMEIAGRWFLAQVPVATPPQAAKLFTPPDIFEPGELTGACATMWQVTVAMVDCPSAHDYMLEVIHNTEIEVGHARRRGWDPFYDEPYCVEKVRDFHEKFASCKIADLPPPAIEPLGTSRNKIMFKAFRAMDEGNRDALRALFTGVSPCAHVTDIDKRVADGLAATIVALQFAHLRKDEVTLLCPGVTQHRMSLLFRMPDNTMYGAQMTEVESDGRWWVTELPIAKPLAPSRVADYLGKSPPSGDELVLAESSFAKGALSPTCAAMWKRALELRSCRRVFQAKIASTEAEAWFHQAVAGAKLTDEVCRDNLKIYNTDFANCRN